jgi:hypothetical protein
MKKHPERPIPLVELPREQDPVQVGLLIRSARTAPGENTPGVTWRIRDTLHRRTARRARVLRYALTGMVIFVTGGVVGAVVQPFVRARVFSSGAPTVTPTTPPVPGHSARRRSLLKPSAADEPAVQVPEARAEPSQSEKPNCEIPIPAASPPAAKPKPKPVPIQLAALQSPAQASPQPAPPVTPAPASTPAPQPGEQALISTALGKLRTSHEPSAALATLDEYRARFPGGVLAPEAARLRTEALLLLGRKATVLDELDRTLSGEASAGDERLVLRGELRAAAGRWRAALTDFDGFVRAHPTIAIGGPEADDGRLRDRIERALWGRASARSHTGDDEGARADLHEYLRRFPRGRFAVRAGQLLDQGPPP